MRRMWLFLPTGHSWYVSMAALAWLVVGAAIAVGLHLLRPEWRPDNSLFLLGVFILPVSIVFLLLAVWYERCPAPKFVWGCGTLLLVTGSILMITASAALSPSFPKGNALTELLLGLICIGSPVMMTLAIPVRVAFPRIRGDLMQRDREEREREARDTKGPAG
jgi:hypothetical protein